MQWIVPVDLGEQISAPPKAAVCQEGSSVLSPSKIMGRATSKSRAYSAKYCMWAATRGRWRAAGPQLFQYQVGEEVKGGGKEKRGSRRGVSLLIIIVKSSMISQGRDYATLAHQRSMINYTPAPPKLVSALKR